MYANRGGYASAIDQLRSAVRFDPIRPPPTITWRKAYSKSGEKALASREFEVFQRLRAQENKSSQERDQVAQLIVDMNSSVK